MHTKLIRSRNFDNEDETGSAILTPDIENRFDNLITTPPGSTTRSSSSSEASSDGSNSSSSSQEDASKQQNVPDQTDINPTPSASTIIPSTENMLPSANALIPSTENMLPAADTVLPSNENVLLLADKLLPSVGTMESSDDMLLPSDDKLLPSDNMLLPSDNMLLPSDDKLLPSDDKLLPSDDKLLPSDDKLLPSKEINLDHSAFTAEEKSSIVTTDKPDLDAVEPEDKTLEDTNDPNKTIGSDSEALKVISEAIDDIDASYRSNISETNIEQAATVISAWLNTSNQ